MSFFKRKQKTQDTTDAGLVMASLGGDREAFCLIVERYQRLLCSLAYSATGDLKHSEDIAQEAFVEAWKKLDTLKEAEKLKAWLCGILRFKISHYLRKEERQPVRGAEDIESQLDHESDQPRLEDHVIRNQEQALLWQTLEQIPENYREPLVLFYREQQSVTNVARELDLSEDVVKQRLSRGRKLLQKAMISFVEDSLAKSAPSVAFTASVFAAINLVAPPAAQAAVMGSGAAKVGAALKWTGFLALLAAFSGVISAFLGVKAGLAQSRTQREHRNVVVFTAMYFGVVIVFVLGMYGFKYLAIHEVATPWVLALSSQLLVFLFTIIYIWLTFYLLKKTRDIRAQERIFNPEAFTGLTDVPESKQREFKSRIHLLGVPLFHFRFSTPERGDGPVFGWIAGGDRAYGLIFAWGGIAVAPISVGIVAVGALGIGAVGFGVLLGMGTVGVGLVGFGASAIGYQAYASLSSLAWLGAFSNGFSVAKEAAFGPFAFAKEVNSELAADIAQLSLFSQSYLWLLGLLAVLVITPAALHWRAVKKRMG